MNSDSIALPTMDRLIPRFRPDRQVDLVVGMIRRIALPKATGRLDPVTVNLPKSRRQGCVSVTEDG